MQVFTQNAGCMLKHGPTFLAATWSGDVDARTTPEHGLYQEDTRFLSRLVLQLNQQAPLLLQATVSHDSRCLTTHLTNPQLLLESGHVLPKRTIHLVRTSLLWEHVLYQQLVITSCSAEPCLVALTLSLDADFADVFEIQGYARSADGRREIAHGPDGQLGFRYTGADALERRATVGFTSRPAWLDETTASMVLTLQPQQSRICGWSVALSSMLAEPAVWSFAQADQRHRAAITHADLHATINTSQTLLQHWLDQSIADIEMLLTRREHIWYPDAGLPWCRAPAGRDGIFTALALLWYRPEIARGVLTYLAATQATTYDSRRGAEPAKS
ncbi:MAG: hypothetical protein HC837_14270 [Chloroflexaceae bacterium]|nr:hypothetical protein [Chloroflexaceae bacterium]